VLGRLLKRATREPVDVDRIYSEIETLTRDNWGQPDTKREAEIVRLRQQAGVGLKHGAGARREIVDPDFDALPAGGDGIPEVQGEQLTPGLVRAAILRHGSLIARGLVDAERASRLTADIDQAIEASDGSESRPSGNGFFTPLAVDELAPSRSVTMSTGTLLLADCPRVAVEVVSLYEDANLRRVIEGYLDEPPALSADKTTLRKATPSEPGGWHQDGKFLGDVNSLNLWVSLSHCGDTAPGLDLVPRRLDEIVEAGVGPDGLAAITVRHERAEQLAGELGIARPVFEPGDGIFFDHLNLHRTASEPDMIGTRYAIESWFFGPSAFPEGYTSLAF
jgi:hypothetical protein